MRFLTLTHGSRWKGPVRSGARPDVPRPATVLSECPKDLSLYRVSTVLSKRVGRLTMIVDHRISPAV